MAYQKTTQIPEEQMALNRSIYLAQKRLYKENICTCPGHFPEELPCFKGSAPVCCNRCLVAADCNGDFGCGTFRRLMKDPTADLDKVWVNTYYITRHYGGSEEGGWWYNNYELLDSIQVSQGQAKTVVVIKEAQFADQAWGNIYSVRGGAEVAVYIENESGESQTKEKPHYE